MATASLAMLLGCGFDATGEAIPVSGGATDASPGSTAAASTDSALDTSGTDMPLDEGSSGAPETGEVTGDEPTEPVVSIGGCTEPDEDCVCTPLDGAHACTHSFGGVYANLGCSGGFQCCDGAWWRGPGVCGPCLCTDPTGEQGCAAPDGATAICHPRFRASSSTIPADVQAEMTGLSWKAELDCPPFSALRLLFVNHWTFEGDVAEGELVVHHTAVDDLIDVFGNAFDARFPIEKIERIDAYGADDNLSMAANNTSAFNCRLVTGGSSLSQHSYGTAIDINPVQNPYVSSGGTVYPPAGGAYLDREDVRPGMIVEPGPVVSAFDAIGWGWGGRWMNLKDYQHFSESGL